MPSWTSTATPDFDPLLNKRLLLEGIVIGALYGLFLRGYILALASPHRISWLIQTDLVMTVSFLFLVPP